MRSATESAYVRTEVDACGKLRIYAIDSTEKTFPDDDPEGLMNFTNIA